MNSELFSKMSEGLEDVPVCSEAFSWVLTFWGVVRHYEVPTCLLSGC